MDRRVGDNSSVIEEFSQIIKQDRQRTKINQLAPLLVLFALTVFFSIFAGGFFSFTNLVAILNQMAIPLVLSIGATFVIIIGGIDLSIEGLMGLTGTLTAYLILNKTTPLNLGILGVVLVLAVGGAVGLLSGYIHVKRKVPSFLLTYGMSSIAAGVTLLIYKGIPIEIEDAAFLSIARTSFVGIPVIMWISLILFIIAYIIQEFTAFGRYIYAIGSNENVPRSTGINVDKVKILVFAFSGLCIALAGVLGAARLARGDLLIGTSNLFPAITAVVVGGTSLLGGKGGVINSLIGTIIVTILNNGLILLSVSPYIITGIQGLIILLAVAFSIDRSKGTINK